MSKILAPAPDMRPGDPYPAKGADAPDGAADEVLLDDPQEWEQRAAAACLAPGGEWSTTLSTTFNR